MLSLPQPLEAQIKPLMARLAPYLKEPLSYPLIFVSTQQQKLYLNTVKSDIKQYIISTSFLGTGNKSGSHQTPLGIHHISEKFGDNAPLGTIFKARTNTGKIATILTNANQQSNADNITSRILWLSGLEEGVNKGSHNNTNIDSYDRYIYIHGTDEEGKLGTPSSHGCIRMRNTDVIALYEQAPIGTLVIILP